MSDGTTAGTKKQVWLNGALLEAAAARVSVTDPGFLTGLGAFETLRVYQGIPFEFQLHYKRLERAAKRLDFGVPDASTLAEAARSVLRTNGMETGEACLRITATPANALVTVEPLPRIPRSSRVVRSGHRVNEKAATAGLKTTSYVENVVARRMAQISGADEALFANTRGDLCEGACSNVFVVVEGRLRTPSLDSGCLPGVTRAVVLERCRSDGLEVDEEALPMDVVETCEEVFLTSSLREVLPVSRIDARDMPCPGPVTQRVSRLFRKRVDSFVEDYNHSRAL